MVVGGLSSARHGQPLGVPAWGWLSIGYVTLALFLGQIALDAYLSKARVSARLDALLSGIEGSLLPENPSVVAGLAPLPAAALAGPQPTLVGHLEFTIPVVNDSEVAYLFRILEASFSVDTLSDPVVFAGQASGDIHIRSKQRRQVALGGPDDLPQPLIAPLRGTGYFKIHYGGIEGDRWYEWYYPFDWRCDPSASHPPLIGQIRPTAGEYHKALFGEETPRRAWWSWRRWFQSS
jgi:hypothetical protein